MVVVFLVLAPLVWAVSLARCQRSTPLSLSLARVCWSESGPRRLRECGALWHALTSRAARRGVPVASHLTQYAGGVESPHRTQRAWLAHLSDSSARPAHWPVHLPWEGRWSLGWRTLRKHARWMVDTPSPEHWSPCASPPLDWGVGRAVERYQARNPTAQIIDCGPTLNTFLTP